MLVVLTVLFNRQAVKKCIYIVSLIMSWNSLNTIWPGFFIEYKISKTNHYVYCYLRNCNGHFTIYEKIDRDFLSISWMASLFGTVCYFNLFHMGSHAEIQVKSHRHYLVWRENTTSDMFPSYIYFAQHSEVVELHGDLK